MRFVRRTAFAAVSLCTLSLAAAPFSVAPAQAQAATAKVRVAHFSPDAPAVDVYVDGVKKLVNVPFQAMSDYVDVPSGTRRLEVRETGAAATGAPLLALDPSVAAGKRYTVAALGPKASLRPALWTDDLTVPTAGKAKVRAIHAAVDTAPVDVNAAAGTPVVKNLAFGTASPYVELAGGPYDLQITASGTGAAVLGKSVTLVAGGIYTIVALGGAGKPVSIRGFVDLAPSAAVVGSSSTPTTGTPATAAPTTATSTVPVTTVPVTEAPITEPTTTIVDVAATGETTTSLPTPLGAAGTGVGGLSGRTSLLPLSVLVLVALGAVGLGARRRRLA